jgi:hypothetical protein
MAAYTWLIQGLFQPEKEAESAVERERERRGELPLAPSSFSAYSDSPPRLTTYIRSSLSRRSKKRI